tara:strand:- start:3854 stop:5779 length:1926 start_codon:yes stop_codon:yes gene_type:complete
MADEMYGDGGVDFAKQTFAESRERKRIEAKRAEDFSKKLQLLDIGIRGVNFLINQRADNLETKQIPALAAYKNLLTSADASKKLLNTYQNAPDKNAFVSKYIYDNSLQTVLDTYGYLDENSVKSLVKEYSNNQAKLLQPEFDRMYTELQDVPDFETFKANYSKFANRQTPRNLFGLATKKIKNIFKSETPSTLAIKAEKQKNAIYDSPLYNEIEEYKTALKAFETKGLDIQGLLDKVKAEKDAGNLVGKLQGTPKIELVNDGFGNQIPTIFATRINNNGQLILDVTKGDANSSIPVAVKPATDAELKSAQTIFISTLKKLDNKQSKNILEKLGDEEGIKDDRTYAMTVHKIATSNPSIDLAQASAYVYARMVDENPADIVTLFSEQPTLYNVDAKTGAFSYEKTSAYFIDSENKKMFDYTVNLKDAILEAIAGDETLTIDQKEEYKENISSEFTRITGRPVEIITKDNEVNLSSENNIDRDFKGFEINKNIWEQSNNVATLQLRNNAGGTYTRKYLNNFEDVVNNLNYSNLDFEQLVTLENLNQEELTQLLGIPSSIKFTKQRLRNNGIAVFKEKVAEAIQKYDLQENASYVNEVVKKYNRINRPEQLKTDKYFISGQINKKENMPSIEFFEEFRKQLLTP